MMHFLGSLIRDRSGATAIEYGLIIALVAVTGIAGLGELGDSLSGIFTKVSTTLSANS